jgi:hypothetical protein
MSFYYFFGDVKAKACAGDICFAGALGAGEFVE